MRNLSITQVRIQNFRSIRNETIVFPTSSGFRFLFGDNQASPELGANGAGKSTLWMAIHWCFFGVGPKGERGERTAILTTWGQDSTTVDVTLQDGDQTYTIVRSGPPNHVTVGGHSVEQSDINNLLGLSKTRFQHSVIFAQGQRLFPDLPIPERGELLEDILNLNYWAKCSETASSELDAQNKMVSAQNQAIAVLRGELTGLGTEQVIQDKIDSWEVEHKRTVDDLLHKLNTWRTIFRERRQDLEAKHNKWVEYAQTRINTLITTIERTEVIYNNLLQQGVENLNELKSKINQYKQEKGQLERAYAIAQDRIRVIQAEQGFWAMTTECSACGQPITENHRSAQRKKLSEEYATLNRANEQRRLLLDTAIKHLDEVSNQYLAAVVTNETNQTQIKALENQIKSSESEIEQQLTEWESGGPYLSQIASMDTEPNPYNDLLNKEQNTTNPYIIELDQFMVRRSSLTDTISKERKVLADLEQKAICIEFWKHGFKRLRLYLINRILGVLEVEINSAITSLGLIGWQIKLMIETETKSGTTKLGAQILVLPPNASESIHWDSFSGGESQRLRIGMAFGVASLIQRSCGVNWSLEVYDEPTKGLSAEGVEDLMEILDYRAQTHQKQIWVCDHIAPVYSNFSEIWTAIKTTDKGTVIKQLN